MNTALLPACQDLYITINAQADEMSDDITDIF
jgi:hypothetical protein